MKVKERGSAVEMEHVKGTKKGDIVLYALSTCIWCRKTKELLNSLGVDYKFVFVDQLDPEEQDRVMQDVAKWNTSGSFPTIVFDNASCIIGFKPDDIKKKLSK